jgi:hypothetical protein
MDDTVCGNPVVWILGVMVILSTVCGNPVVWILGVMVILSTYGNYRRGLICSEPNELGELDNPDYWAGHT